jgi:hypothetical protein
MTTIQFTNEKGNVSAKARKHIKDSVIAKIVSAFEGAGLDAVINADGGLSIATAVNEADGAVIFTHLDFTVSTRNPDTKTAKSKKRTRTVSNETVLPDLFATEDEAEA